MDPEEAKVFKNDLAMMEVAVGQILATLRKQIRWLDGEIEVAERERAKEITGLA